MGRREGDFLPSETSAENGPEGDVTLPHWGISFFLSQHETKGGWGASDVNDNRFDLSSAKKRREKNRRRSE